MISIKKQIFILFIPFANSYILYAFFKNSKFYRTGWRLKQLLAQICGALLTLPLLFFEEQFNSFSSYIFGGVGRGFELIVFFVFAFNTFASLLLCQKWCGIDWE